MRTGLLPILLSLLLLGLSGQALAAPCGTEPAGEEPMPMDTGASGGHQSHCGPDAGGDCAQPDNCDSDCSCCPGHCAGAIPANNNEPASEPEYGNSAATTYLEFNSSPEPEAAIRPPICH